MSERVLIEPVPVHGDARGCVLEPFLERHLPLQRNVHAVLSRPGEVRGNHLHRRGTELMTVLGPALVRTREGDRQTDTEVPAGEAYRFTIPPGVAHAVRNTGTGMQLVVAASTVAHDPADPDTFREVILE